MTNKILTILISFMLTFSLYGQNIEGNWNGNLMIENEEMALVFNFKKKMKNTLEQWIFQVKEQLECL